jgi:8-oxo-dGTP diphosphatase
MGKRKGSHGAGTWSFPGGWMRHGESFLDTARREAKEETGLEVSRVEVIDAISTVFKDRDVHSVTVVLLVNSWQGFPLPRESNKLEGNWQWFSLKDLPSPLFEPINPDRIRDLLLST